MPGLLKILLLLLCVGSLHAEETGMAYGNDREMQIARHKLKHHHGGESFLFAMADRLEYQSNEGEPLLLWDLQGWYGGDINKVWLKSEGEYAHETDEVEEAEIQLLYSRAISAFWDFQAGLRYDNNPGQDRSHVVLGFQGLAPYWFEIDAAAFASNKGDVSFRVELEYDLRLTQRLVLQPRVEISAALQEDAETATGSGFNAIDAGLRLRYEFTREFAPYLGINWGRALGETADFRRAESEGVDQFSIVAGIRFWY